MAAASAMHCILARLHDTGTSTHHIEEFVALAATEAATRMWVNQVRGLVRCVRQLTAWVALPLAVAGGRFDRLEFSYFACTTAAGRFYFLLCAARPELGAGAGGRGVRFAVR